MKKASLLGATTLFAVAISLSQPAFAQEAPCPDDDNDGVCNADEVDSGGAIIVTGTRIARPTLDSQVPLTSVTPEELTGTGEISLGDALNDLPSLRSTFSSGNSSRFIGTAGLSFLDLRGLGTDRTLVLVNGRRHVTSSPGDNGFDINTIPSDLVQRVDIITGGNSAVYGSDAVAGVVNFVLRQDYDGLSVRGQAGISSRGDRGSYFMSALWGRNFADGRGNITLSAEFTRQQPLLFRERDALTGAFSGRCQYDLNDLTAGEPAAGDGIPDQIFFCGVRNATISDNGTIGAIDPTSSLTRRFLRFDATGDIVIDTPTRSQAPLGGGNQIGGTGSTLRETGSLLAEVNRYAVNGFFRFAVSDAFEPFIEAKFVRTEVSGEGQSSFFTSVPGTLGGPPFRCDNGFFSAQNLTQLRSFGLCAGTTAGTAIGTTGVLRGVAGQTMPLARFNTDFGGRRFSGTRDTYRIVGGIEGSFNDDWRYEIAANYGRFEASGFNQNNLYIFDVDGNAAGFNVAVDAVIAPTTFTGSNFTLNSAGQRVICRVNAVTNVDANCVPFNVFGDGVFDPRAYAYSHRDSNTEEFADQLIVSGFLAGDFSQLFELPGGPISFVLGAEWRRERASVDYDELTSSGGTFLNALQDFRPPDLEVREAYGEIQLPLLDDLPFAHELVVTLAGRVSDYNNATGTVYAYNIQGVYAPIEDIRFRAAYATSVRAPTQGDLFSPQGENFANGLADPCDSLNINAGPNRVANCAAAGVPTTANAAVVAACASSAFPLTVGAPWLNCSARTSGTSILQGGNPTLIEERGRSLTIGAVFEPRFLPGLNFTVDYYRIRVKNLIAVLGAQAIVNNCYDNAGGINNSFCSTINRDPATGLFNVPALVAGGINFAAQRTEGVDFDLSYRRTFDNGQRLTLRALVTRVMELNNFTDPTFPTQPNRQLSELGDPRWAASFNVAYDFGSWDVLYAARYIGRQTIAAYETQNAYRSLCPASGVTPNTGGINGAAIACTAGTLVTVQPNNADVFPQVFYPEVIYHDLRLGFDVGTDFRFYAGVSNILDRQPPLGLLGTAGGDPYDSFGRNFFFGFNAEW